MGENMKQGILTLRQFYFKLVPKMGIRMKFKPLGAGRKSSALISNHKMYLISQKFNTIWSLGGKGWNTNMLFQLLPRPPDKSV